MEYADASSADVVLMDIRKTVVVPHRARIERGWCGGLKRTLECTCEAHLVRDVVVDCSSQQRCERTGVLLDGVEQPDVDDGRAHMADIMVVSNPACEYPFYPV